MQRVRIGITGLAFVFLFVLLAMILTREPVGEQPITPNLIESQRSGLPTSPVAGTPAAPAEPLAELGVAPGKSDSNATSTSVSPESPPLTE